MIDTLTPADAPAAASLSAGFGWPHRTEDWAWFLRVGSGIGWRENGMLLGTALLFPLDAAHAAIGGVQVLANLQGLGIGRQLMQAAIASAGGRSLKLHATAAGAGLYARLGFRDHGVVEQWQGIVGPGHGTPTLATIADLPAIHALDQAATGLDRLALLQSLLEVSTVALAGPRHAPSGYAMRRMFGRGALLGPIVAPNATEAATLVAGLQQPGFQRLDIPAGSGMIAALAEPGLASIEDVQVMVRGPWPTPVSGAQLLGLASQAIR